LAIAKGSGSSPAAVAGAATALGAGGMSVGRRISKEHDDVQYSNLGFGEEHLLGGAFRIPAGLFLRKHVLFESQQKVKVPEEIGICFVKPKSGCVTVAVPRLRGM
jgi:hypothetical protein